YGFFRLTPSTYKNQPAYTTVFYISYHLNLGGQTQEMSIREEKIYLPGEGLTAFSSRNDSLMGTVSFVGKKKKNRFEVTTPTGKQIIPAPGEKLSDALTDMVLVQSRAPVGTKVESDQLETTLLKSVRVIHTVDSIEKKTLGGVPAEIYKIKSVFPDLGITTTSLIDQQLHTIEAKVSMLTIREEEEAAAKDMGYVNDLLPATSIRPDRTIPDPRKIRLLTLELGGITDPDLILSSPRQEFNRIDEETYYLKITVPGDPAGPSLGIPILQPELKDYLNATVYIQSTHPSIRTLAKKIAVDEKDSYAVAEKLVNWLYLNLEKSFLAALPNAVDILKRRAGDCKAHAVLLTALARSLGIPTRIVSGLVEIEDGAFYYHQWAEIYTGNWLPVDPVLGQIPVDATHIKLSQGDLSQQLRILNAIGTISIEVLDYEVNVEDKELGLKRGRGREKKVESKKAN
ncbi:MAG: transglutaminase family protein, partial [Candidatus Auribacterota bacterium]|nr:transglutaminase family protein [Candidatus Auribacterota bacterium]